MQRYANKVGLVTGGGSGIGEGICLRLASEGAAVSVLDIDLAGAERVAAAIQATGGRAQALKADVTDFGSLTAAVAATVAAYGGLDVAVNCAGIGGGIHLLTEFPIEAFEKTIAVNLTGTFLSMRAELPALEARGGGAIVNIASMVGAVAHPMTCAYVASKHGVVGLTRSAALEWGPRKVRVNAVGPTWVRTPLTEAAVGGDEAWAALDAEHAVGRCATVEDIAAVVAFLSADEAGVITGAFYMADGGYTAR